VSQPPTRRACPRLSPAQTRNELRRRNKSFRLELSRSIVNKSIVTPGRKLRIARLTLAAAATTIFGNVAFADYYIIQKKNF